MSNDVEATVIDRVKNGKYFAIQDDESIDVANFAVVLVIAQYLKGNEVNENLFLFQNVQETNWASKHQNCLRILPGKSFFSGPQVLAAEVTKPAPDFKGTAVVGNSFKEIKLSDFAEKYLVLFFYPLDFTFVCPTEIIAYSEKAADFRTANTELVAVSTDSHFSHLAWTNTPRKQGGLGKINIPLLSDFNKSISRDYGVLLEGPGLALRGLFIIDPKSVVRHITINDLPIGRSVDETLRVIKALQFVERHGEVCPAGWQPDSPTIKPDPVKANEYFEKVN